MNKQDTTQIGDEFEERAYNFLKDRFDKVIWLSKSDRKSHADFQVFKNGESFLIDAKSNKTGIYHKKDLDYIVTQVDGDIYIEDLIEVRGNIFEREEERRNILPKITKELEQNQDGLTIQELSNNTEISRNTIVKFLAKLEGANRLEIRIVGMAKLYKLKETRK